LVAAKTSGKTLILLSKTSFFERNSAAYSIPLKSLENFYDHHARQERR